MKQWFFLVAASLGLFLGRVQAAETWEAEYARLLQTYTTPEGVRYEAWHGNPADVAALAAITKQIAAQGPINTTREGTLAFLINAYNIGMLHEVLAAYPIRSVQNIAPNFGVFSEDRITVAGEQMSLNTLEKERMLKAFGEPRVHFAVNCASVSCPPLLAEPFTGDRLEEQLDQVTRAFLAEPGPHAYIVERRRIRVSRLFEWYRADFNPPGTIEFINRYRKNPLPTDLRIDFLNYDWNLNRIE